MWDNCSVNFRVDNKKNNFHEIINSKINDIFKNQMKP